MDNAPTRSNFLYFTTNIQFQQRAGTSSTGTRLLILASQLKVNEKKFLRLESFQQIFQQFTLTPKVVTMTTM